MNVIVYPSKIGKLQTVDRDLLCADVRFGDDIERISLKRSELTALLIAADSQHTTNVRVRYWNDAVISLEVIDEFAVLVV